MRHLRLCCLNARPIKNKSADFVCYASSTGADIFAITESWLSERDMGKISAQPHTTLPLGKQICFTIGWDCAEILPQ